MNYMVEQVRSLATLLDEIFQPVDESVRAALDHELCLSLKRIFITGCGDSHHAALGSELALESLTGLPVEPMTAQQMARYAAGQIPQTGPLTNLVVGVSVSGGVARTAEALTMAREFGAATAALTATPGSRVAEAAERVILAQTPSFPEPEGTHCPGIRSYFANQVALLLIAVRIGEVRGRVSPDRATALRAEIRGLSAAIHETAAACEPAAKALATEWADACEFVFVGGGPNYGTALFSAAKILEASGDPALGQETEEWCHLQYFAREANTPTIVITAGDRDFSRMEEMVTAARALGRRVAAIAPKRVGHLLPDVRLLPFADVPEMYSPLVAAIAGELFAAFRAEHLGETYFRGFTGGRDIAGGGGISRIRTSATWEAWRS